MQSLIISWAVCARLALIKKSSGANVLVVETVICDTSITLVLAMARKRPGIMVSARYVSSNGNVLFAVRNLKS